MSVFTHCNIVTTDNFSIVVKPKWRNLDSNDKQSSTFGGKWVLVGSITFKKKSKEPLSLNTMTLSWNGETMDNLVASLYLKNSSREFIPIEQNLVCDGTWNKTKQMLIFNFEEKETLAPKTTFYVVFTIPETIEPVLTKGFFTIEENSVPKPFKHCCQSAQLTLVKNTQYPVSLTL